MSKNIVLSSQQKELISGVVDEFKHKVIAVNASSGSSKSSSIMFSLIDPRARWIKSGYFLAYNKKIAVENGHDLSKNGISNVNSSTIHSFALRYLKHMGHSFKITNIDADAVMKGLGVPRNKASKVSWLINKYSNSSILSVLDFATQEPTVQKSNEIVNLAKDYIGRVYNGELNPSHGLYVKWAMTLMIDNPPVMDFLFIDEFADANQVTYEMFKLIKAKKKVCAGDVAQNINKYLDTIDGISKSVKEMNASEFSLTQSFRLTNRIANAVNDFTKRYELSEIEMIGLDRPESINTIAILTRTNAELISTAMMLIDEGKVFSLARNIDNIIGDIMYLMARAKKEEAYYEKYGKYSKDVGNESKWIVSFFREATHGSARDKNGEVLNMMKSLMAYANSVVKSGMYPMNEISLSNIILTEVDVGFLFELKDMYKKWKKDGLLEKTNTLLSTVTTSKGLTVDAVYLTSKCEKKTLEEYTKFIKKGVDEKSERMLMYVGMSRARYEVYGLTRAITRGLTSSEYSTSLEMFVKKYYKFDKTVGVTKRTGRL